MYENRGLISDWDTLRLMLAIDRYGGVSGAARFLQVTHATVSRRLAKAEADAGLHFYERLPAGLRLTDVGKKILDHASRIEPELFSLERALMSAEKGLSGLLRITIPPLMMTDAVSLDVVEFKKKHPNVELEFIGQNTVLNLHQREADIAIRVTRKPPETLWGRKLTDQDSAFYASAKWHETEAVNLNDMKLQIPIVSFMAWDTAIPKIVTEIYPNAKSVARVDDMPTAIQMVRAGLGITRMPCVIGNNSQGLKRVQTLPWENYAPIWLLTHPELRKVPRVEAFMRHISSRFTQRSAQYQMCK